MGEGLELYNAIDAWYMDARKKLTLLLKEQPEPFKAPQDIQAPLRIMRDAMECEGMLISLQNTCEVLWPEHIADIEQKLRGIRDSLGRMVADSIVKGVSQSNSKPEDYGFIVTPHQDDEGVTIELPYEMIAMSDLFMLRSKRISELSSLASVRSAWTSLVALAVEQIKESGSYPIAHVTVHVLLELKGRRSLDPDHFWIRPIIDGLCESQLILGDDANHLILTQEYRTNSEFNRVRITISPTVKTDTKDDIETQQIGSINELL